MKDFFQRQNLTLDVGDLRRFAQLLMRDISPILTGYEFVIRLFDSPGQFRELQETAKDSVLRKRCRREEQSGKLHLPVVYNGIVLALVTATPQTEKALSSETFTLLPIIIRLSLEKILLYKINITDRETGLNNQDYFYSFVKRKTSEPLSKQSEPGTLKPLSLSKDEGGYGPSVLMIEIKGFDKLAATYGKIETAKIVATLATAVKEDELKPSCVARFDRSRLAVFYSQENPLDIEKITERLAEKPTIFESGGLPDVKLSFGLANFPRDITFEPVKSEKGDNLKKDLAELLVERAELALNYHGLDKRRNILSYRSILKEGGRVVQVLPYNRVVVNLGRTAGAREGQVFLVKSSGQSNEYDYKGEVVLFDVREDFALGEVANLRTSLTQVQPNDCLLFNMEPEKRYGADQTEGRRDALLGVLDYRGFLSQIDRLMDERERFALVLINVDDYDKFRTTMGNIESDRQFKLLYELLRNELPDDVLIGRFSNESLIVFIPDVKNDEAHELCLALRDGIKSGMRQTASFGAAVFPCGPFQRPDMVVNAQKALEHASFFGPASVAVFDSVSMNISGDKLFESGDWQGAISEYKQGLELNPEDLNLLNSLGVCYGYLNNVDDALSTFSRVIEIDPDNLMAHFNIGFALAAANRPEDALENFRKASAADPENFDVLFQIGKINLELDRVDDALESFEKAAALKNKKPIIYRYLGQTLLKAEKSAEAIDAFKAAVRNDPEDAPSLSQLGVLFLQGERDTDIALSLIRQAVEQDQTNSLFRQRLARALTAAGSLEQAVEEYEQAVKMGARSREVYLELGFVLKEIGRLDDARLNFEKSLAADPEFKSAADALKQLNDSTGVDEKKADSEKAALNHAE